MINDLDIVQWEYLLSPEFELINSAGKPLTGGWIEVYLHGTRDKYYCASDFDGTLHPFKIPLDSIGANVVLADPNNAYDVYVYNKFGSLIMSRYNVKCQGSGGSSTYVGDKLYYGQYRANNVTTIANLRRNKGNINITDDGYLKFKSDMSYHITVRGSFTVDDPANEDTTLNYIEYTSVNPIKIDIDETKEGPQYFELSYDIYRLQEDMDYQVAFAQSNGLVKDLIVEVHSLSNLATSATGGDQKYEAGWGIDITNNVVSVDPSILEDYTYTAGDYISIDGDNVISVTGINPADYATHDEVYEATVTAIEFVSGMIPEAQVQSDWNETDTEDPAYIKNKPTETEFVAGQNIGLFAEGTTLTICASATDLSDYVTHVELEEAISAVTGIGDYGQFYATDISGAATMARTKGTINVTNDGKIMLKKGSSYHVTMRGRYNQTTASNTLSTLSLIEYVTNNSISVNVDTTITDSQYFEISYDLYKLNSDTNYYVFFNVPAGKINDLFVEIHAIGSVGAGVSGGAGTEYDAGWGIQILNNVISVDPSILNDYTTNEDVYNSTVSAINLVTGMIPEAQVQSDWTQDDNTQVDYIKNKPEEYDLVAGDNIAINVSGSNIVISSTGGGGGSTYTAGDNIEIDNDVISVKDVILINARSESASGQSAFGNVTHWGNQDYGPGWWISAHTDNDKDYVAYNTSDLGQEEFFWGEYATNRETNGVSAVSQLSIHEGDIVYKAGEFQDVSTLPIVWSCSQMAQDIEDLKNGSTYTAGTGIDITNNTISVDNTVAMKTDIPAVSGFATKTELYAVAAEIPTLPDDQEVVFEELDLSDYALASAIPVVSGLATKTELVDVEAEIPTIQLNSSDEVISINNYPIHSEGGGGSTYTAGTGIDITNDVISVSGVAMASAIDVVSGKLPTTELGKFTIHSNVSGGPIEVICPTDQAPDSVFYQINSVSGNAYASSTNSAVINYYYGETPADFNGSDDAILFTINDNISNIRYINFYYVDSKSAMNGPSLSTSAILGDSTGTLQSGSYKVKAQYNQAGTSSPYGKYLEIMFGWNHYATDAAQSLQWAQEALSKITFFGVVRPDPTLGAIVDLNRYELGNTNTITSTSGYTEACVYTDPVTKKQSVYMSYSMPSNWSANNNIAQGFEYGTNGNSPSNINYNTKQYRAYKYTSSPTHYQFAYCTDWDYANKVMTFIAYDNSGNAIEKWTLDYTTYRSNIWTTTPISAGSTYTAGEHISIENDEIAVTGITELVAGENITITTSGASAIISSTGEAQVQANWNETNTSSKAYIQNKPTIHNYTGASGIDITNDTISLDNPVGLVAGDNITIEVSGVSAIISSTGGSGSSYTAGTGIDITNDVISVDNTVAMKTDIPVVTGFATKSELQTVSAAIPDTTDMATQTWVGDQGYLTSVPSNYVTDSELNGAVSGLATKTEVTTGLGTKQNTLTGITDVQVVQSLPVSPEATVLYLIPEA